MLRLLFRENPLKLITSRLFCTISESPAIIKENEPLNIVQSMRKPREVWIENFNTVQEQKLGIKELSPIIYGTNPRVDVIHENVVWQQKYKRVSFAHSKSRSEVRGGGKKPWPQKGMGRARHGSIRSPIWRGGGKAHGPRNPTSYFYMLPYYSRVLGLTSMLSVKLAQDDLHIISDLNIPTDDPNFIKELVKERLWGPSVLMVDVDDIMPRNITVATDAIQHFNLMPAYGLNVYSMLKHDTLVLTEAAADHIQEKLLEALNLCNYLNVQKKYRLDQV